MNFLDEKVLTGLSLSPCHLCSGSTHRLSLRRNPWIRPLYYNGTIVRTVVPPATFPNTGIDNFYKVTNGVTGQLGIASVAPGADGYHGGHWKVFIVTFNPEATPVLLTSQAAVLAAQSSGAITVTRNASADFLCPVQP